jgi:integrase
VASISYSDGRATIQFVDVDGKRKSIRLGAALKRTAESVKLRVEVLLNGKITNTPIDRDTATWLTGIGDELAAKLAAVGLVPARASALLDGFLVAYIDRRTDIKAWTRINLEQCRRRLVEFFGKGRPLASITPGDADAWLLWLKERYADGTAGRTLKRARQFFRSAVRSRLIPSNPFDDVKPPSQTNEARKHFVSRETAQQVLDACPDAEWRLIVALCRYAGIRCPSELLPLQWAEVDWERGRFLVHSPKTEHHEGGAERWVPIFPELRPYLEDAFEQAEPGTVFLINRYRDPAVNLRTQFLRVIRRAGVAAWPKLFQNLRASRETELAATFPLHVVCAWIGNSALIAQKHYLQVTDADFAKATLGTSEGGEKSGAKSGAVAVQNAVQSVHDRDCQQSPKMPEVPIAEDVRQVLSIVCKSLQDKGMPLVGLEPTTH